MTGADRPPKSYLDFWPHNKLHDTCYCLYKDVSVINHAGIPNVRLSQEHGMDYSYVTVRAIKDIQAGEEVFGCQLHADGEACPLSMGLTNTSVAHRPSWQDIYVRRRADTV